MSPEIERLGDTGVIMPEPDIQHYPGLDRQNDEVCRKQICSFLKLLSVQYSLLLVCKKQKSSVDAAAKYAEYPYPAAAKYRSFGPSGIYNVTSQVLKS